MQAASVVEQGDLCMLLSQPRSAPVPPLGAAKTADANFKVESCTLSLSLSVSQLLETQAGAYWIHIEKQNNLSTEKLVVRSPRSPRPQCLKYTMFDGCNAFPMSPFCAGQAARHRRRRASTIKRETFQGIRSRRTGQGGACYLHNVRLCRWPSKLERASDMGESSNPVCLRLQNNSVFSPALKRLLCRMTDLHCVLVVWRG